MRAAQTRMNTRGRFIHFWLFVLPLTLILAACGGGPAATLVFRGTDTPTPIPSALPEVATALPAQARSAVLRALREGIFELMIES